MILSQKENRTKISNALWLAFIAILSVGHLRAAEVDEKEEEPFYEDAIKPNIGSVNAFVTPYGSNVVTTPYDKTIANSNALVSEEPFHDHLRKRNIGSISTVSTLSSYGGNVLTAPRDNSNILVSSDNAVPTPCNEAAEDVSTFVKKHKRGSLIFFLVTTWISLETGAYLIAENSIPTFETYPSGFQQGPLQSALSFYDGTEQNAIMENPPTLVEQIELNQKKIDLLLSQDEGDVNSNELQADSQFSSEEWGLTKKECIKRVQERLKRHGIIPLPSEEVEALMQIPEGDAALFVPQLTESLLEHTLPDIAVDEERLALINEMTQYVCLQMQQGENRRRLKPTVKLAGIKIDIGKYIDIVMDAIFIKGVMAIYNLLKDIVNVCLNCDPDREHVNTFMVFARAALITYGFCDACITCCDIGDNPDDSCCLTLTKQVKLCKFCGCRAGSCACIIPPALVVTCIGCKDSWDVSGIGRCLKWCCCPFTSAASVCNFCSNDSWSCLIKINTKLKEWERDLQSEKVYKCCGKHFKLNMNELKDDAANTALTARFTLYWTISILIIAYIAFRLYFPERGYKFGDAVRVTFETLFSDIAEFVERDSDFEEYDYPDRTGTNTSIIEDTTTPAPI